MPENKNINKIKKELEQNRDILDQNSKEIKGYGSIAKKIIDPKTQDINFDNLSVSNAKSISTNLFNIKGKDNLTDYQIAEVLFSQISNTNDINDSALEELILSHRHSYKEYDVLTKEFAEIQRAMEMMASDIVYPNVNGLSGLKIEFKNNNDQVNGERYDDLIKFLKPLEDISLTMMSKRLYSFDIHKELISRIISTLKYGATMVVTIPYSNIANDLLYDSHKRSQRLGETYQSFDKDRYYYFDDLDELEKQIQTSYENKQSGMRKDITVNLGENFNYNLNKITGENKEYAHDFIDTMFYSQSDVDALSLILAQEGKDIIEDNESYTTTGGASDVFELVSKGEAIYDKENNSGLPNNEFLALENIREKRKLKFNLDKIKGCTTDVIDLKRALPLFIKNELMGVLLIKQENEFSNQKLGTSLRMLLTPEQTDIYSPGAGNSVKERMRQIILDDMGRTLQRNMSKKLLRNNPTLIEDMEYLLDELDIESLVKTRVRFIPAEYITLYTVGEGVMGTSFIEKSKVYIHAAVNLMKSELIHQIFLNRDRYIFKIPHSNDSSVAIMVRQALKLFRNAMPTFSHLANNDTINNTLASRSTMIIPTTPNDKPLFDIEKLDQTQYTPVDQDFYNKIRNQATAHFGYPADMLDPNSNIDFAKKITQINLTTAMLVMTLQNQFTLPISEECTRRIRYMTGNPALECIVTFDPPRELKDTAIGEILNQTNTISEVYEKIIDEDTSIEEDNKGIAKYYLREELLKGVVDLKLIDKVKERYQIEGVPSTEDVE